MGSYWSSEIWSDMPSQKPDIKPIEKTYTQKEDSPVTIVEYPIGYIDELKNKFKDDHNVRTRSKSQD